MRRTIAGLILGGAAACIAGCSSSVSGGAEGGAAPGRGGAGGHGAAGGEGGAGGVLEPVDCEEICEINGVEQCMNAMACREECATLKVEPCSEEGEAFLRCVGEQIFACKAPECLTHLESWLECTGGPVCGTNPICSGIDTWWDCIEECFNVLRRHSHCSREDQSSEVWSCQCVYGQNLDGIVCEGDAGDFSGCCAEFFEQYDP